METTVLSEPDQPELILVKAWAHFISTEADPWIANFNKGLIQSDI